MSNQKGWLELGLIYCLRLNKEKKGVWGFWGEGYGRALSLVMNEMFTWLP